MRAPVPLLLALALAACGAPEQNAPAPSNPADAASPDIANDEPIRLDGTRDDDPVPTVFDRAQIVFDSIEPPPAPPVQIPDPRPPPRPRPAPPRERPVPVPIPAPPPLPAPSPAPPVAGSCDVRESAGYCFSYTGAAWTARGAETHCAEAPASSFLGAECPVQGRAATCVFRRSGDSSREIVYTYYTPTDLAVAELACPGQFTVIDAP